MAGDLGTVTATDAAPFAAASFTYARTVSGVAGACTKYDNTATIVETKQTADKSVTLCVGKDLTISKTAAGTFDRTYLWQISKDVDKTSVRIANGSQATFNYTVIAEQTGLTDSNWKLSGVITLTNPNLWENITLTSLSDVVDNGGTCTVAAGPYTVLAGKTLNVAYTCSYSAASSLSGTNKATASWDKATYFTPTGTASAEKAFTLSQVGATNKTVHVTDTFGGALGTLTATDAAPFTRQTFTYSHSFAGVGGKCTNYDNTATITETGQSDKVTVEVCVGRDLTVSKTTVATYDRLYKWLIDKSVDKTRIYIFYGGTATFNYTVKVTPNGFTDSNWIMYGKITVTNPNNWEDITADVTDVYDGGGLCTVTGGTAVLIPAGKSVLLDYSCAFTSQPAYTGKNTAIATWDKAAAFTPTGSASGIANVSFTAGVETNKTITVVDDKTNPASPVTLGTSNYNTGPFVFTYALQKKGVAGKCTNYTNIATIKQTGQSDTVTVTVCTGLNLGAKTIGFWQNKNGQAIILNAGSVNGVCKLTPWLRQFKPFQDLSTTASCTTAAAYVTKIINSANASGASMNAMLKAQMLATSLDVYFSDPLLGGNKIGAPAPIGGVTIDLTKINGTQNVSAAFGGATKLTVMQMLTYAAGQSNAGGTIWYGNVKTTQGLAKNAFDAINNNKVFAP